MKKYLVTAILLLISISPLFRGLFFQYEAYIFFTAITGFSALYFFIKTFNYEPLYLRNLGAALSMLLIAAYLISTSAAVNIRAHIDALLLYITVFLVFMVLYDHFKENKVSIPVLAFLPLIFSGFIAAILGMAGYTKAFPQLADTVNDDRIGSTLQYANTAAVYFLILLVLTVALVINSENIFVKAALAGIGNTLFMALFFTSSRGVYIIVPFIVLIILILSMPAGARMKCAGFIFCITLPMLLSMKGFAANSRITNWISASKWVVLAFGISAAAAFALSLILRLKMSRKIKYTVLAVMAAVFVGIYYMNYSAFNTAVAAFVADNIPKNIIDRIYDINLTTRSVVYRFVFFEDALKLIRQHWLLGLGGGGFAALYQSVQDSFYTARLVHNHYLQVFVEAGILGFLAFGLLVVSAFVYYAISILRIKTYRERVYISGSLCAFVALSSHSAIDFNLSYNSMALIFWSLIAVGAAYAFNTKRVKEGRAEAQSLTQAGEPDKSGARISGIAVPSNLAPALLLALSMLVIAFSGHYILSAHYAQLGDRYKESMDTEKAVEYYEKAVGMDSLNPAYHAELAERYRWMASCSKTGDERKMWIGKAVESGEKAVRLSPYYPYYRQVLAMACFESGQPVAAWEQTDKLVKLQPKKTDNYSLLAKGTLEAGLALLKENRSDEAGKLLLECSKLSNNPAVKVTPEMAYQIGKAWLLLGDFGQAEKLLNTARGGSLELKMNSDRLLYIINEETGNGVKNEAFRGVPWMGVIRLTPDYKEIKQILSSKVLAGVLKNAS